MRSVTRTLLDIWRIYVERSVPALNLRATKPYLLWAMFITVSTSQLVRGCHGII